MSFEITKLGVIDDGVEMIYQGLIFCTFIGPFEILFLMIDMASSRAHKQDNIILYVNCSYLNTPTKLKVRGVAMAL